LITNEPRLPGADQKDSQEAEEKTLISEWRSLLKKVFDRAEIVRDARPSNDATRRVSAPPKAQTVSLVS
jgi:hypothetical protein